MLRKAVKSRGLTMGDDSIKSNREKVEKGGKTMNNMPTQPKTSSRIGIPSSNHTVSLVRDDVYVSKSAPMDAFKQETSITKSKTFYQSTIHDIQVKLSDSRKRKAGGDGSSLDDGKKAEVGPHGSIPEANSKRLQERYAGKGLKRERQSQDLPQCRLSESVHHHPNKASRNQKHTNGPVELIDLTSDTYPPYKSERQKAKRRKRNLLAVNEMLDCEIIDLISDSDEQGSVQPIQRIVEQGIRGRDVHAQSGASCNVVQRAFNLVVKREPEVVPMIKSEPEPESNVKPTTSSPASSPASSPTSSAVPPPFASIPDHYVVSSIEANEQSSQEENEMDDQGSIPDVTTLLDPAGSSSTMRNETNDKPCTACKKVWPIQHFGEPKGKAKKHCLRCRCRNATRHWRRSKDKQLSPDVERNALTIEITRLRKWINAWRVHGIDLKKSEIDEVVHGVRGCFSLLTVTEMDVICGDLTPSTPAMAKSKKKSEKYGGDLGINAFQERQDALWRAKIAEQAIKKRHPSPQHGSSSSMSDVLPTSAINNPASQLSGDHRSIHNLSVMQNMVGIMEDTINELDKTYQSLSPASLQKFITGVFDSEREIKRMERWAKVMKKACKAATRKENALNEALRQDQKQNDLVKDMVALETEGEEEGQTWKRNLEKTRARVEAYGDVEDDDSMGEHDVSMGEDDGLMGEDEDYDEEENEDGVEMEEDGNEDDEEDGNEDDEEDGNEDDEEDIADHSIEDRGGYSGADDEEDDSLGPNFP